MLFVAVAVSAMRRGCHSSDAAAAASAGRSSLLVKQLQYRCCGMTVLDRHVPHSSHIKEPMVRHK